MSFVVAAEPPCSQHRSIVPSAQEHCPLSLMMGLLDSYCLCHALCIGQIQPSSTHSILLRLSVKGPVGQVTVFESSEFGKEAFVMRR